MTVQTPIEPSSFNLAGSLNAAEVYMSVPAVILTKAGNFSNSPAEQDILMVNICVKKVVLTGTLMKFFSANCSLGL